MKTNKNCILNKQTSFIIVTMFYLLYYLEEQQTLTNYAPTQHTNSKL